MKRPSHEAELTLLKEMLSLLAEDEVRLILERALDALIRLCGAERGFLVMRRGEALDVVSARHLDSSHVRGALHEFSHTLLRRALDEGRSLLYENAAAHAELRGIESVSRLKLLSVLVVPLKCDGVPLGAVYVENRRASRLFDEETARLAEAFAELAAAALGRARTLRALRETVEVYEALPGRGEAFGDLVGEDPAFLEILETVATAARSDLPLLIEGETGTGKGLLARAAHRAGPRSGRPFVHINCAGLPESLLEDELFGHVKGAFSGAHAEREGLFAAADGGTLFLDEVAEMSPAMQAKLLTVVEEGVVRKVGSDRPARVDVRIVSATVRTLHREVAAGRFREDLYFRLNGVRVVLPPLRRRKGDLPALVRHFVRSASRAAGIAPPPVTDEAMRRLGAHDYPGNVRELESIIRRSLLFLEDGRIGAASLPAELGGEAPSGVSGGPPRTGRELKEALAAARAEAASAIEREFLEWALREADGNVSEAARRTGMNRSQLQQMLARHGLRGRRKTRHD